MLIKYTQKDSSLLKPLEAIPIDEERLAPADWQSSEYETTLAAPFTLSGPSTYHRGTTATITFRPAEDGWHFNRTDLPEQPPIPVAAHNVASSKRNILLSAGIPQNHQRMSEHIIAMKLGMGLDNVAIDTATGDPPLFDVGSRPIVEQIQKAGISMLEKKARYFTTKESVVLKGKNGSFLLFEPTNEKKLTLDVAIDFPTAIGRQRIVFDVTPDAFAYGADARTNCSHKEWILMHTIGRLIPSISGFGYTKQNILIAGKHGYYNTPALLHNGKCLEPVWHRACLDLLAALALKPEGRLAGKLTSFKAGHGLDCQFMTLMAEQNLWKEL